MSTSATDVWLEAGRFRLSPNDAPREKNERLVPQGYLRISEAYDRHLGAAIIMIVIIAVVRLWPL